MLRRLLIIRVLAILTAVVSISTAQSDSEIFTLSAEVIDPYRDGLLLDYGGMASQETEINRIIRIIGAGEGLTDQNSLGYHCLAYNLKVISIILEHYPIQSVRQVPHFFDQEIKVNGETYTLNSLEQHLIAKYDHGAIHFLLISGTQSSPSLPIHGIIKSDQAALDGILKSVLNNREYTYVYQPTQLINLSPIFDWHSQDFGGIDRVIALIESYNTVNLDGYDLEYDKYDWTLNDTKNGIRTRYYPTRLLTKSEVEFRLYENYYTQVDPNPSQGLETRSSRFDQNISLLFGSNRNLNWGVSMRLRSVNVTPNRFIGTYFSGIQFFNEPTFTRGGVETYRRFGLTAIGPQVKYRPKYNLRGTSLMVHSLTVPIGKALEGDETMGFLDWAGYSLNNQWLYERDLSPKRNIFFDIGLQIENIDGRLFRGEGGNVVISTPVTATYHYFPAPKWTLYGLANVAPRIALQNFGAVESSFVPFAQIGGGIRRFVSDLVELEFLITQYFSGNLQRNAQTVNIGLRYNY